LGHKKSPEGLLPQGFVLFCFSLILSYHKCHCGILLQSVAKCASLKSESDFPAILHD
jgi:hypothetical protein